MQVVGPWPKVSIIIVNWNRREDVLVGLEHLEQVDYPDLEIIVVDSGSTDGSVEALHVRGGIEVVEMGRNVGPARARNVGAGRATGKYLLFLDSDAVLAKHGLKHLVQRMERSPEVGAAGCKIINAYTRGIDQWIYAESRHTHHSREFETYAFSTAGALVRTTAMQEAGGFWEDLFIYNEDTDLSLRMIRAGYHIIFYPGLRVYHRASPSGRLGNGSFWYHQSRNWIWMFYRYYPGLWRWWAISLYVSLYLVKAAVNLHLLRCMAGIAAGLRRVDIIARYDMKLNRQELAKLRKLNPRRSIRLWPDRRPDVLRYRTPPGGRRAAGRQRSLVRS